VQASRVNRWQPTETAAVLWPFVLAILLGWLVFLAFGHPIVISP
jgi:hypothetical protein